MLVKRDMLQAHQDRKPLRSYEMAYLNNQNGWATSEDWTKHRQTITALYCNENKTLKEVMQIMREKHDFVAT